MASLSSLLILSIIRLIIRSIMLIVLPSGYRVKTCCQPQSPSARGWRQNVLEQAVPPIAALTAIIFQLLTRYIDQDQLGGAQKALGCQKISSWRATALSTDFFTLRASRYGFSPVLTCAGQMGVDSLWAAGFETLDIVYRGGDTTAAEIISGNQYCCTPQLAADLIYITRETNGSLRNKITIGNVVVSVSMVTSRNFTKGGNAISRNTMLNPITTKI